MITHEGRLAALGLVDELPPAPKPFGVYRPTLSVPLNSESTLLYVSGHGPMLRDGKFMSGKVGGTISKEEGKQAARQTGLSILASLRARLGTLNRARRLVKSLVMVNGAESFGEHIFVANGYSELMRDVFGAEAGVGIRSAVGMGSLPGHPGQIPVEVELIVEIDNDEAEKPAAGGTPWFQRPGETSLRPVINGCGHFTSLGGSRLHPKALEAMAAVSGTFVDINALLARAGERIAALARAPPGYGAHVTTGAAAGLALATAACLCRADPKAPAASSRARPRIFWGRKSRRASSRGRSRGCCPTRRACASGACCSTAARTGGGTSRSR